MNEPPAVKKAAGARREEQTANLPLKKGQTMMGFFK